MDYSNHSVKDFVFDEFFQKWILNPDGAANSFWEHWLKIHPEKLAYINEAKNIIENLRFPFYRLTDNEIEELWRRMKNPWTF